MAGTVTAIIVTRDHAPVLPESLTALKVEGVDAIVVDNASADVSPEIARIFGCEVIRNARDEGFGRAANRGVARAESEFVLLMQPDAIVQGGAIAALIRTARRFPDAALIAPRLVEPDGSMHYPARPFLAAYLGNPKGMPPEPPQGDVCVPTASCGCFLMRRVLFQQIGGFDQELVGDHADDDLCRRIADARLAIVLTPTALVRRLPPRPERDKDRAWAAGWHAAWARAYLSRKYGLPDPAIGIVLESVGAYIAAMWRLRPDDAARHRGAAAGALAWLRGTTALKHEGLAREAGL